MPFKNSLLNTTTDYGWITIFLHWIIAFIVLGLFGLGFWMVELDYYHSWYHTAPDLHKSIGICLLLMMLFRTFWRYKQLTPDPLDSHNHIEKLAGHFVHLLLYLIIFITMISGYLISTADGRAIIVFGLLEVPALGELFDNQEDKAGLIHQYLAYSLIVLVLLHALAALKHHFIDKDRTLIRMLTTNN